MTGGTPEERSNKIASVTAVFWIMKICATTLGETERRAMSQPSLE